eukprot:2088422-Alexandrium_andersonii.AAC.1
MPATRGALKHMVLEKSRAKNSAPQGGSPGELGKIKLVLATAQSYILMYSAETKKWPLVVSCTWPDHRAIMEELWAHALTHKVTKQQLVAMRDKRKA